MPVGRGHLDGFQDEPSFSRLHKMLTTGVDAYLPQYCFVQTISSMIDFKADHRTWGRGFGRHAETCWFTIIDYVGATHNLFYDPAFDGVRAE